MFYIETRPQAVVLHLRVGPVKSLTIQLLFAGDTEFDMEKFHSEEYQRTFQYLTQFANGSNLDTFSFIYDPCVIIGDPVDALKIIIK
jgi:hypothetical protein